MLTQRGGRRHKDPPAALAARHPSAHRPTLVAPGFHADPAYLWVVDYPDTPNAAVAWAYDDEGIHADKSLSVFRPPQERGVWYTGYFPVAAHTSMLP